MWPKGKGILCCLVLVLLALEGQGLDNGLALTPPMGWMAWARFTCETDCETYPEECISEKLFMAMADRLVDEGYKDLGYDQVNIDDCWPEKERDPTTGRLIPDKKRFPNGIKALADYVHSKGLKLGIYGDLGTLTCGGYPGFLGENGTFKYVDVDVQTFAEWGIDMIKVDGCYADSKSFDTTYPKLGDALNATGRPMVYSCSWPAYQDGEGIAPNYTAIAQTCNLWRNYGDIEDSWGSVLGILDYYAKNQDIYTQHNGPGAWFDPDMIIIGNFGLSDDQSRAQMALWSILSAPLLMSNDLRSITETQKSILQNRDVIGVNQDKKGIMGRRLFVENKYEIWMKPVDDSKNFAVVYFNRNTLGTATYVSKALRDIIAPKVLAGGVYYVYDLFDGNKLVDKLTDADNLQLRVNPSGVRMVKIVAQ